MKIVITGSTMGIGFAMAEKFLSLGDDVCISSRKDKNVATALNNLQERFPNRKIVGKTCDVSFLSQVQELADFAWKELGEVDMWVNNAGTKGPKAAPLYELEEKEITIPIETNLKGLLLACHVAINKMMMQGHGMIFNMEGLGSNGRASPFSISYGATKASIPQILKSLKKELSGSKVLINNISPGMVLTDLLLENNYSTEPDSNIKSRQVFNILAEKPETVVDFLVPRMKKVKKSGKRIQFLTGFKAGVRFMTAWRFKNRWFDEEGKPTENF